MTDAQPPTRRARTDDGGPAVGLPPVPPLPDDVRAAGSEVTTPEVDDDADGRLPTAQLEMAAFGDHLIPYAPPVPPKPPSVAPWALGVAIIALAAALFTGWLLPIGAVGAVLAIVSLRRAHDSRRVAVWALALAVLSVVFSAGWLIWGFSQLSVG
ncbi:hypothetical protein J2X55_001102 [Microbacterium sp. 1154]|uniref:hypothetical protein n=1 Tax=Microbacterium sp. 1154 TaxID=2817733 RepID=UPI000E284049|nr:hypothetical protein [Microbacterium sp. 1154]MDR6690203.1 hypothetical protein [Microbacterium sp. 1154]